MAKKVDLNHRTWQLRNQVEIMPDTWLINFMHRMPQRNQLCLNQLTLLCISLQQDVRRSALQKIAYCTEFMYWPIVIMII